MASSSSTQSSGGRPPFDSPSDMLPRDATKRMPSSAAACDLVIDPAAVLEDVGVVEGRRAAGEGKLAEADDCRRPVTRRVCARPKPDTALQPGKKVGVCALGKLRVRVWSR